MSDRDGPRSNPYHLDPRVACEACVFTTGEHAAWCAQRAAIQQMQQTLRGWGPSGDKQTEQ